MGYRSPYSTPEDTPLRPEIVEASTPWSDVLLEEHATLRIDAPMSYKELLRSTLKAQLRSWNRTLWLAIFLVAGISWSLLGGTKYMASLPDNAEGLSHPVEVDGMQFIDATHPYIRVGILRQHKRVTY